MKSRLIATCLGCGHVPYAPGTVGALLGMLQGLALESLHPLISLFIFCLLFMLGVKVCERATYFYANEDPACVIWDEYVGMFLVCALAGPFTRWEIPLAFALFRLYDITKIGPVGWLERRYHGGWGIMLDDVGAALLAVATLAAYRAVRGM